MTMTAQCVRPADLGKRIKERAAAILDLNERHLSLDWLKEYGLPQLGEACGRVARELPGDAAMGPHIQRELIQSQGFARYLARLLPLLEQGQLDRLDSLLASCQEHGVAVTRYGLKELVECLVYDGLEPNARLVYLENFASMVLPYKQRDTVINSLRQCRDVPVKLTRQQQDQLLEPYVPGSTLFRSSPFREEWELLERCPDLRKIPWLLHNLQIKENLGMPEYARFAEAPGEHIRLLARLTDKLLPAAAARFLDHWQHDGCSLNALGQMVRRTALHGDMDWEKALCSYSGYVNLISGVKFKNLDLAALPQHLEDVLLYAMANGKAHFIRLVDGNPGAFLDLPAYSFLLQGQLYREHFNLNQLSAKDLACCAWMRRAKLDIQHLVPGRRYTFPELRALYGVRKPYLDFYHALKSESQDYRLRVFKEVCKREALRDIAAGSIDALAALLDQKPLSVWRQELFSHIDGLSPADTARLLVHLDGVRHLLPGMESRSDVLLALRSLDALGQFQTMDGFKARLMEVDGDWRSLAQTMGLTADFIEQHRESIAGFLSQDGAAIASAYMRCLDEAHQEAYLRVVKAELMGRLREVKYHEGDLRRELDMNIPSRVKSQWPENLAVTVGGMEAGEHDGFFDTMLLGCQPQRTCLSYLDGMYRKCLLSAFDSNKKVLYARLDGRIVGRAFLRLTKCRRTSAGGGSLTFVDLEAGGTGQQEREQMTLFLERPYISGLGPEAKTQAAQALVELAKRKAEELGILLVLSQDYADYSPQGFTQTRLHIFISKSKGGAQYLDSLDGEAAVSKEGSYQANRFLIQN